MHNNSTRIATDQLDSPAGLVQATSRGTKAFKCSKMQILHASNCNTTPNVFIFIVYNMALHDPTMLRLTRHSWQARRAAQHSTTHAFEQNCQYFNVLKVALRSSVVLLCPPIALTTVLGPCNHTKHGSNNVTMCSMVHHAIGQA